MQLQHKQVVAILVHFIDRELQIRLQLLSSLEHHLQEWSAANDKQKKKGVGQVSDQHHHHRNSQSSHRRHVII